MTIKEFDKASAKSYLLHDARYQLDLKIQCDEFDKEDLLSFIIDDILKIEVYEFQETFSIKEYYKYLLGLKRLLEEE